LNKAAAHQIAAIQSQPVTRASARFITDKIH
jgi:hypothetical protein